MCRRPIARRPPAWTRGGRGGRYWRSRLVVRSDAGDDPEGFHDVGGDLPGVDHWPAARVAAALVSAGHLGGVGRRDRAGDDWQRRLQAHNETFTFLADIGFALIKSIRARPAHCRAGCLVLAIGAPAAARWRLGDPSAPTSRRTRRLGPPQVSGSQPTGSR